MGTNGLYLDSHRFLDECGGSMDCTCRTLFSLGMEHCHGWVLTLVRTKRDENDPTHLEQASLTKSFQCPSH